MNPNGRLFQAKLKVSRSAVERGDQGIASTQIGLGRSDQSI